MTVDSVGGGLVAHFIVPLRESPTVIDVIQAAMGIVRVINNQGTTQAIAILVQEMAVVPESPLRIATNQ